MSIYVLTSEITIGGKKFARVNGVEVVSSAKVLEDTCTIKLPATARLQRAGEPVTEVETAKVFAVGDEVSVKLGYDGVLREDFTGYVSAIVPGMPVEVQCIDATWLLRRKNLQASYRTVTLEALLAFIVKDTGISISGDVPEITFKNFYFKNVTAAFALNKLKEDYGLTLYMRGKSLFVGLTSFTDDVIKSYGLGLNVIDNDLKWVDENDTRLKIKAIHVKRDNTRVTKEVGDADGELRTLFIYDLDKEADLEKVALAEITKYKYTGYKGSLTAFLWPNVTVGNVCRLSDPAFAERAGDYLVDKVTTTFGTDGARRKIELGLKVSVNG